jgi:3-phenylpropionate/trans-cinnamate dioxygenase ferredoxin reductase subunit
MKVPRLRQTESTVYAPATRGFDGPVVLIGDEAERPYERPPLSKDYLLGKAEREAIYVHPASWYAANGVELRLGVPVTGIDRASHEVALADGAQSAPPHTPLRLQRPSSGHYSRYQGGFGPMMAGPWPAARRPGYRCACD